MKRKLWAVMLILVFIFATACSLNTDFPQLYVKQSETEIPDFRTEPPEYEFTQLTENNSSLQDYPALAEDLSNVVNLSLENQESSYEFLQPISNRLTDEEWKEMLNSDSAPERESWIKEYIVYEPQ
ncbi:MAG: DUF3160 domain-containing protein [Clostridiales bacterium]|jgi:hypothetical protein|nr:DUF3160 domain-containing protein [Clostridiales bacterium]